MHKNQVDICLPQHRLNNFIEILGMHHHRPQTQSRTSGKQQQKTVNFYFRWHATFPWPPHSRDLTAPLSQPGRGAPQHSSCRPWSRVRRIPARVYFVAGPHIFIYIIVVFHTVVVSPPAAAARHGDQEMVSTVAIVGSFLTPAASGLLQINQNWRSTFIFRVFPIFLLNPFKLDYSLITHPL